MHIMCLLAFWVLATEVARNTSMPQLVARVAVRRTLKQSQLDLPEVPRPAIAAGSGGRGTGILLQCG